MSNEFDLDLVHELHAFLKKEAFSPASGMGGPPAGGAMPPAGGAMPPAPPMDPSMMGGAPPMDPSMMGGAPPMDPSMGGMPPMDPAMMGGMPPEGGAPPGGESVTVGIEDLLTLFSQIAQEMQASGGGEGAPNEPAPDVTKALDDITKRLESIESKLGGGEPPVPEGAAGAAPPPGMDAEGLPTDPAEMEALISEIQGMDAASMGAGSMPGMDATAAPMPAGMPISASGEETMKKISSAKTIGDLVAKLRRDKK